MSCTAEHVKLGGLSEKWTKRRTRQNAMKRLWWSLKHSILWAKWFVNWNIYDHDMGRWFPTQGKLRWY